MVCCIRNVSLNAYFSVYYILFLFSQVEFSMPANNLLGKDVYITVCSKKDEVLAFLNIPARECPAKWYPLKPTNASKLQF